MTLEGSVTGTAERYPRVAYERALELGGFHIIASPLAAQTLSDRLTLEATAVGGGGGGAEAASLVTRFEIGGRSGLRIPTDPPTRRRGAMRGASKPRSSVTGSRDREKAQRRE